MSPIHTIFISLEGNLDIETEDTYILDIVFGISEYFVIVYFIFEALRKIRLLLGWSVDGDRQ